MNINIFFKYSKRWKELIISNSNNNNNYDNNIKLINWIIISCYWIKRKNRKRIYIFFQWFLFYLKYIRTRNITTIIQQPSTLLTISSQNCHLSSPKVLRSIYLFQFPPSSPHSVYQKYWPISTLRATIDHLKIV